MRPYFITGIGTSIGKTLVAAVVTQALKADYWKPVQAGIAEGTDSEWIASVVENKTTVIHPESYKLNFPASPHIAARKENLQIDLKKILADYNRFDKNRLLIIEGPGGLMVPLNENEFVTDLIRELNARVILVSRNYLGSINHSLMTAGLCRSLGFDVAGWVFNDQFMHYEEDIVRWSGYASLFSLPLFKTITGDTVSQAAEGLELSYLYPSV